MNAHQTRSIAILGATFATPNLGVSALAAGSVRCLHKRYPDARLFFLDYEPPVTRLVHEEDGVIAVPMVQMRFSKRVWLANNIVVLLILAALHRLLAFKTARAVLRRKNPTFNAICETDLFTAVSGGDSFSDLYGLPRFLYVSLPQILALILGKPLIQLPQTYGPFKGRFARFIARQIVRRSARAFCRDFTSFDALFDADGDLSHRANAAFCYDMAFGIDSIAPESLDIDGIDLERVDRKRLVGVNVSGLLYRESAGQQSSFGIRGNYRATVLAALEYFLTEENATVLLIPHVFGQEPNSESDLEACKEIYAELQGKFSGRLGIACGNYGPNEIRSLIGQCAFFTGSRMHACIAAWSQCIPALAIAYSDKFLGVLHTINVESLAADARSLTEQEILAKLRDAYHRRAELKARLESVIPQVRTAVHQMLFEHEQSQMQSATHESGVETCAVL